MSATTAKRLAIALAAALLMAAAVCWAPGGAPDPAPTATVVAIPAPAAAATPTATTAPTVTPAPAPTLTPTASAAPAATSTPVMRSSRAADSTPTPFTLSDLAATSTPITALLPPALPTVAVPPTPTAAPAPVETPAAAAAPSPTAAPSTALLPPTLPSGPVVLVGSAVFGVEVASTPEEKRIGLSGREGLAPGSGMLFLYANGRPHEFWMKDMLFAIDIVWIAPDCTVGDITHALRPPRPGAPDSEVLRAHPSAEAAHVLEITAGASIEHGLRQGDPVRFIDIPYPAGDSC